MEALEEGPAESRARRLRLLAIGDYADRRQFTGDGTRAHPPLFDRDVAAAFPFQVDDDRFAIAAYVMTRNLGRMTAPRANPNRRYDLPPETYRLRLEAFVPYPERIWMLWISSTAARPLRASSGAQHP